MFVREAVEDGRRGRTIWKSFCEKLRSDSLTADDFTEEMAPLFAGLLIGPNARERRLRFADAPARFFDTPTRAVVQLSCPDDEYRFDFVRRAEVEGGRLAFVECITLPLAEITLPCTVFSPLPDKEGAIRCERDASAMVRQYLRFKSLLGKEEAVRQFLDGDGELLAARSWVPFYSDGLALVAYLAWMENRLNGERTAITRFTETRCELWFYGHLQRRIYALSGHLETADRRGRIPGAHRSRLAGPCPGWRLAVGMPVRGGGYGVGFYPGGRLTSPRSPESGLPAPIRCGEGEKPSPSIPSRPCF